MKQGRGAVPHSAAFGAPSEADQQKREQPRRSILAFIFLLFPLFVSSILLWGCALTVPPSQTAQPSGLSIQTSTLPPAVVGQAYSQQIRASGGLPPYTWSVISGSLPPGMVLTPSGLLTGLPLQVNTTPGGYQFEIEVQDSSKKAELVAAKISFGG